MSPFRGGLCIGWRRTIYGKDATCEAIAAKGDKEEFSPLAVVGIDEDESDGHAGFDGCNIGGGVWGGRCWWRGLDPRPYRGDGVI
jgi:hypothetical protein